MSTMRGPGIGVGMRAERTLHGRGARAGQADTPKRKPRYHKTGRTAQLNCRVMPAIFSKVYKIADRHGWLVGETVEHAIEALERDMLKREKKGQGGA